MREADRFEARDLAYFERVSRAYRKRVVADEARFLVLDASQSRERIAEAIQSDLVRVFEHWQRGGLASGCQPSPAGAVG